MMSMVRRHCSGVISMAWRHPTTPAKQSKISIEPLAAAAAKARLTLSTSVTSTGSMMILADGKSFCRASIASAEVSKVERRSKRNRLARPCSRSARAAARASVPAPPVTAQTSVSLLAGEAIHAVKSWFAQFGEQCLNIHTDSISLYSEASHSSSFGI